MGLRAIARAPLPSEDTESKKTKVQRLEASLLDLRSRVRKLEDDKQKLIAQLVDFEETKAENERLRRQLLKEANGEK